MNEPEALLAENDVAGALQALQQKIRSKPADSQLRVFLFQLYAVLGQWDKALTQLNLAGEMDDSALAMVVMYRQVLTCEAYREQVFKGEKDPLIFGDPAEWTASLIQALKLEMNGNTAEARALRESAREVMPAVSGVVNDQPFEWLMDGDSRLGPILEVMLEGRYLWVPFNTIAQIDIEEPEDLRDVIWMPAHFVWTNGGESFGVVPTRYPDSEKKDDGMLALSRKTEWMDKNEGAYYGMGQRMFMSDESDFPLMDIRKIQFTHEEVGSDDG